MPGGVHFTLRLVGYTNRTSGLGTSEAFTQSIRLRLNLQMIFTLNQIMEPPVYVYPNILLGAGAMLTPRFVADHHITHVINCAFPEDSPSWFRTRYASRYVDLRAIDSTTVKILDWYPKFEETMHRFLRSPGVGTIFVHCQAGVNRSAFLLIYFMTRNFGFDFLMSVKNVRRFRTVCTNPAFMKEITDTL